MVKQNKLVNFLFFLFSLSPFIAYFYSIVFKLPKNITYPLTIIAFLIAIVFLSQKKHVYYPRFAIFSIFFAIYHSIWRFNTEADINFLTDIYYHLIYFSIFGSILIIYNSVFLQSFIKINILIFQITVLIAFIVSIIQVFNIGFLNPDVSGFDNYGNISNMDIIYQFRRTSIFGLIESNALGLAFVPMLSVLLGYMLHNKYNWFSILSVFIMGGTVSALSNTRYVMIGFIIISIQLLAYSRARIKEYFKFILTASITLLILYQILIVLGYNFEDFYYLRLFAEGSITETTRYKAFETFIEFFPEKPIIGYGSMTQEIIDTSQFRGSSHIHVGYLSHLVAYGLVGCFFLFSFWYLLVIRLYKTALLTNYWGSFFAFLMFFFSFTTMSQSSILYSGLIFAIIFDKYYRDKFLLMQSKY